MLDYIQHSLQYLRFYSNDNDNKYIIKTRVYIINVKQSKRLPDQGARQE